MTSPSVSKASTSTRTLRLLPQSCQGPSSLSGELRDSPPSPTMAIKMFQLRKRLLYKSEGHNHSDNQASSDDKTKSGDHRDKSTVKPLTATVANISSLRTLRSVAMTSQKASPDHGHLSTVSAPTRSYKRLGTSSPLFSVKRRRTNLPSHAPSPIMASVAVASRSSPLPLSTRPTTPASHSSPKDTKTPPKIGYALPKSVFEDLDDDQVCL